MSELLYSPKIQKAIALAITTHEVHDKQKRKGKDTPYIIHPLIAGMILAHANAREEVIVAGILHDTIEDSIEDKKVTYDLLKEKFGDEVAELVLAVTETDRGKSWEERKDEALAHIEHFSHDAILLKSADVLANGRELINDVEKEGNEVFERFTAPKEKTLWHYGRIISALVEKWPESPLAGDLQNLAKNLATFAEER